MDLKNRRICSKKLWDSKFQGTDGILFKVLLQGTALQGAAHVEVLRF